jgi:hypothetical protein
LFLADCSERAFVENVRVVKEEITFTGEFKALERGR